MNNFAVVGGCLGKEVTEWVVRLVAKVKEWFGSIVHGEVIRYELPQLGALNFVMYDALGGGVTRSLAVDKHGKCLSSYLLEMEI